MKQLIRLNCHHACAGVIVNQLDTIVEAAPIFQKFVGKPVFKLVDWLKKRDLLIEITFLEKF